MRGGRTIRRRTVLSLVVISAIPALLSAAPSAIVLKGAALLDVQKGVMLPGRTIVIEGERIRAIGTSEHPPRIPAGARVIAATGKFIIPGLIDAHGHLTTPIDTAHVTGEEMLPLFLANGITSLRDTGDDIIAESLIARHAEAHPELSPRIFMASRLLDGSPPIHPDSCWAITDPGKVAAFAEDAAAWGAVTLKIYAGTGRPVGQRAIAEAHRFGLIATAHLGKYAAQDAVADGIDCLEHIISVFNYCFPPDVPLEAARDEAAGGGSLRILEARASLDLGNPTARNLVSSLASHRVTVDPTLVVFRNMLLLPELTEGDQYPGSAYVPAQVKRAWRQYLLDLHLDSPSSPRILRSKVFGKYEELTGVLYRAGVPLGVGTDAPCPYCVPGFSFHQELELLVESGLTPAAALQAGTLQGAQILKQTAQLGSVEEGKQADLVILDADPLADIRNTRKIYRVIHRGLVLEPQALLRTLRYDKDKGYHPYMPAVMQ